mmetsp:Transcript_16958/g.36339  ORF Transcript_16958/g.36339 Transcript_16958/m.36339 type:complete len:417 (-) Transcript_16958:331-1581(-)
MLPEAAESNIVDVASRIPLFTPRSFDRELQSLVTEAQTCIIVAEVLKDVVSDALERASPSRPSEADAQRDPSLPCSSTGQLEVRMLVCFGLQADRQHVPSHWQSTACTSKSPPVQSATASASSRGKHGICTDLKQHSIKPKLPPLAQTSACQAKSPQRGEPGLQCSQLEASEMLRQRQPAQQCHTVRAPDAYAAAIQPQVRAMQEFDTPQAAPPLDARRACVASCLLIDQHTFSAVGLPTAEDTTAAGFGNANHWCQSGLTGSRRTLSRAKLARCSSRRRTQEGDLPIRPRAATAHLRESKSRSGLPPFLEFHGPAYGSHSAPDNLSHSCPLDRIPSWDTEDMCQTSALRAATRPSTVMIKPSAPNTTSRRKLAANGGLKEALGVQTPTKKLLDSPAASRKASQLTAAYSAACPLK